MRILFLASALGRGGAERQLLALSERLARRGHEVTVGVFRPGGAWEGASGVRVSVLGDGRRGNLLTVLRRLPALLRVTAPDVIHGYLPVPNLVALVAGRLIRRRPVVWGVRASDMRLDRYDSATRLAHRLEAWFAGRPDLIVANAEAGRRAAVARGMPADRIAVVPNGIARDQFACDPQARAAIRAEWGIPEGVPVIGHVARLDPMKDHATFVAALAGLDALCPRPWRAVLVVEGMPGARAGLTAEVARLGLVARVTVLPGSDEVAACYAGFDLFCQSSAYGEGFPNVVGEAMASGLVVVATDVGDTALVLGSTGQVVAPGDPVALARALAAELRRREDQPAEQLAAIAAQIARFDVENLVDRTERLLLSVMRR